MFKMVEKIGELKNQNLNNAQKEMLINWYETNFDSLDDFSFECETDFEGHFLFLIQLRDVIIILIFYKF